MNPNLFEGCDSMVGFPAAAACPCKSGPDLFLLGLKMQRKARMMLVTVVIVDLETLTSGSSSTAKVWLRGCRVLGAACKLDQLLFQFSLSWQLDSGG